MSITGGSPVVNISLGDDFFSDRRNAYRQDVYLLVRVCLCETASLNVGFKPSTH